MTGRVRSPSPAALDEAAATLREGGVIALPADTNLALAVDPYDPEAVERVYELKGRDRSKPLAVLHHDPSDWRRYADPTRGDLLTALEDAFLPGPLNAIVEKSEQVPDHVVAGLDTVCIGSFRNETWRAFTERVSPVAMTSANRSGAVADGLVDLSTARDQLPEVDVFLDGDGLDWTTQSTTIVDLVGDPSVFREGDIGPEQLNEVRDVF